MPRQVLITGTNSDLGLAVCRRYLQAGYRVIAHYHRGNDTFDRLVAEAKGAVVPMQRDFTDPGAAQALVDSDPAVLKQTDALVNLAALREPISFAAVTPEDILRHMTANVVSAFTLMRLLGAGMAERGWGRIVNVSSIGVKFGGGEKTFCYSLTKHSLEYMPAIANKSWAARNVLLNAIRVGVTSTQTFTNMPAAERDARVALIPAKRMATPAEMAESIFWLGSEQNAFMTGQVVAVAGGE